MKIKFHRPYITGNEIKYISDLIDNGLDMAGDGPYTKKAQKFFEERYGVPKVILTTSATMALEFAIRLLELKPGDEVVAPSFTFSSTINAILTASGVKVVFADIDPETFNIDPKDIERKITNKTKAIMVVHYAGIACDMDRIMEIAKKNNLKVIEDAAQGIESKYKGKYLGTIGDFGCLSFHDTKNITSGEGGALFINSTNKDLLERAEIVKEKGTNRTKFFRGEIDKYTWVDLGSSYLPSDILAAYLWAQLENIDLIIKKRLDVYNYYLAELKDFENKGYIKLPKIGKGIVHNAHIFYMVFNTEEQRNRAMSALKERGIQATAHYVALHSATQGRKLGYKPEDCPITEDFSKRLLRLPLYSAMTKEERKYVIDNVKEIISEINKPIKINIGVPAHNEEKSILETIKNIFAQNSKSFEINKVIIYSDGSTDRTNDLVKSLNNQKIELIETNDRKGKKEAIKDLIYRTQESKSEILVLVDADLKFENKNTIDLLIQKISINPEVIAVSGAVLPNKSITIAQKIGNFGFNLSDYIVKNYKNNSLYFKSSDAFIAIRVSEFAVGEINKYSYLHDEFYFLYAKSKNKIFAYEPNAIVRFNLPSKISDYIKQMTRYVSGHLNEKDVKALGKEEKFYIKDRMLGLLLNLYKSPFYGTLFFILQIFIYIKLSIVNSKFDAKWQVIESTK